MMQLALAPVATAESTATPHALRVAVVTETYPPEVNGVALTVARLVEGLRDRGHSLQLVRPRRGSSDTAQNDAGVRELLLPGVAIPRYRELRMGMPAAARLRQAWSESRPDLVHIATEGPLGWSALRAARSLGLPVTSDFRTNFHAYSAHYGIGWLRVAIVAYLRWFHNCADCTMVPTHALERELGAAGFRRIVVIGRGVDTQRFDPRHRSAQLRAGWGADDEDVVMLYVGRLAAEKNIEVLLAAHAAMRDGRGADRPRVRLVMVGDGPLRAELERRCPDVVFAGQRTGLELSRHYASADLFLFPSLTETWGNVTPEALASGLPVLAFDAAAAAQLVESGRNGVLVPPGDAAAFVRAAAALAHEPAMVRRMGEAARCSALGLGWDDIVREVEAVMCGASRSLALTHGQVRCASHA
jgi:glycosyltransferase involved in cell wall biosynthesis